MRELRERCPWDAAQTPQTLRPYFIEEALELDQAIKSGDPEALRDELGDLLLHLAFQIVIGEERSQFDAEAVTKTIEQKMWRRHPHLWSGAPRADHETWELSKRREPRGGRRTTMSGIPPTLPPLLMAYRLQERAAGVGFDWKDARGPLQKVKEETAELEREAGNGKREAIEDEVGDLLFAAVNLARKLGIEPNQALEKANDKFRRRFEAMEDLAAQRGLEVGRASLEELDRLWEEVKRS
ncbi:MAG TPA: nucleoside triphosphate pyrophosphohydrolase [Gemmatimonadales bacterium]|nr:nucleoside triphosphate pyrophosphohydrolase [Gemmatimonadales bacterium]